MPLRALTLSVSILCMLAVPVAAETKLETEEDKILYTLGLAVSRNIASFDFTEVELQTIAAGLIDGALGRDPQVDPTEYGPKIDAMIQGRLANMVEKEKAAGEAFLAKASEESGARKTEKGMVYREISAGTGDSPGPADKVKLHYHGTLADGTVFDSSREGEPVTFAITGVIPCFGDTVQLMKVGGKSMVTCPSDLAYGDRGSPPKIKPGAALRFEIELLEVIKADAPAGSSMP